MPANPEVIFPKPNSMSIGGSLSFSLDNSIISLSPYHLFSFLRKIKALSKYLISIFRQNSQLFYDIKNNKKKELKIIIKKREKKKTLGYMLEERKKEREMGVWVEIGWIDDHVAFTWRILILLVMERVVKFHIFIGPRVKL